MSKHEMRISFRSQGAEQELFWDVSAKPCRLGRDPSRCDITLDDPWISGCHVEIECREDGLWVRDLGSSNGTWLGGSFLGDTKRPSGGVSLGENGTLYLGGPRGSSETTEVVIGWVEGVYFGGAAAGGGSFSLADHDRETNLSPHVQGAQKKRQASPKATKEEASFRRVGLKTQDVVIAPRKDAVLEEKPTNENKDTPSQAEQVQGASRSASPKEPRHPGMMESSIPPKPTLHPNRSGTEEDVPQAKAAKHEAGSALEKEQGKGQKDEETPHKKDGASVVSEMFPLTTLTRKQSSERVQEGALPKSFREKVVSLGAIRADGLAYEEKEYAALGGGLGSFVWVDALSICGVSREDIAVVGLEEQPYARYRRLCENSQIPSHERLRSNSESRPDCFWGFPSYALSESLRDIGRLRLLDGLSTLWKMFAEPVAAQTYTPRAEDVYASLDREMERIRWGEMLRVYGILAIRKMNDGRYAVLCKVYKGPKRGERRVIVARFVHLALGYPGLRFVEDLQKYREKHRDNEKDAKRVVNAYEDHEHVYKDLRDKKAKVLILRGRGIVASRVLQRIDEVRRVYRCDVQVLHLMREPKLEGHAFGASKRKVAYHWEFQPFNWPKACWGGTLKASLEGANDEQRKKLLDAWGGTTTADRSDWRRLVERGVREGWYQQRFGKVTSVELSEDGRVLTVMEGGALEEQVRLKADYVVDCTGLEDGVRSHAVYRDLLEMYGLSLNPKGRLRVDDHFVVEGMQQEKGLLLASGAMTLGGPYAAVDSFLGLQYAALASLKALRRAKARGLRRFGAWRSFWQWCRWCVGLAPSR